MSHVVIDCEDSELRYEPCPDGGTVLGSADLNSSSISLKLWLKGFNIYLWPSITLAIVVIIIPTSMGLL